MDCLYDRQMGMRDRLAVGWTDSVTDLTRFYQCLRLCSCGTKPQRSKNHHSVMMSSWEPQCHHDIIMRTPRITGKPRFSCSRGPLLEYPFFELGIKHRPQIY